MYNKGFTLLFYFFLLLFFCYCAGVQQGFHLPLLLLPPPVSLLLCRCAARVSPSSLLFLPDALSFAIVQVYSKGFTFLFYFYLLLAVCCALDLVTWGCRLVIPGLRDVSVMRYLAVVEPGVDPQRSPITPHFLQSLGVDGRLLLAVIADHCGPLAAADLTNHLWLVFKDTPRPGPAHSASPDSASAAQPNNNLPSSTEGAAVGSSGGAGSIPMVTIGEGDGDAATKYDEKGKLC